MARRHLLCLLLALLADCAVAQPRLPADGALYLGTSERGRALLVSLHLFPPDGAELQLLEAPVGPGEEPSVELTLTGPYLEHERELEVTTESWTFIADLLPGGGFESAARTRVLDSRGEAELYLDELEPIRFRAIGTVLLDGLRFADGTFAVQRWAPFFYEEPWSELAFDIEMAQIVSEGLQQRRELPQTPVGVFTETRSVTITALDRDLLSYYSVIDSYTGGAHPNSWREATVLLRNGEGWERAARICEVPQRLGWKCDELVLRRRVIADLGRQEAAWVEQGEVSEDTEWLLESYVITPGSVRVLFDPYAVGPYVQGPFEVDLPFRQLAE